VSPALLRALSLAGTTVVLRRMQPDDRARLVRFHHTLSHETTHLRFFAPHPDLLPAELDRFTQVDHVDREAIVAAVGGDLVGVGRFDRVPPGDVAEVAFVVADRWQGRGIGTALLDALEEVAIAVGIRCFVADSLPGNGRMRALLRAGGRSPSVTWEDGVARSTLVLATPPGPG
jgi:GNAT superfamily N-acetyltransferase